jgi:hypothetical protein
MNLGFGRGSSQKPGEAMDEVDLIFSSVRFIPRLIKRQADDGIILASR